MHRFKPGDAVRHKRGARGILLASGRIFVGCNEWHAVIGRWLPCDICPDGEPDEKLWVAYVRATLTEGEQR